MVELLVGRGLAGLLPVSADPQRAKAGWRGWSLGDSVLCSNLLCVKRVSVGRQVVWEFFAA